MKSANKEGPHNELISIILIIKSPSLGDFITLDLEFYLKKRERFNLFEIILF